MLLYRLTHLYHCMHSVGKANAWFITFPDKRVAVQVKLLDSLQCVPYCSASELGFPVRGDISNVHSFTFTTRQQQQQQTFRCDVYRLSPRWWHVQVSFNVFIVDGFRLNTTYHNRCCDYFVSYKDQFRYNKTYNCTRIHMATRPNEGAYSNSPTPLPRWFLGIGAGLTPCTWFPEIYEPRIDAEGRLHYQCLNFESTELAQLLEWVQFRVQRIWLAPRIYKRVQLNLNLNRELCRSPNFMNSYWLNEHVCWLGLHISK